MKGFVPTPEATVDTMVDLLFRERPPDPTDKLLDPGCGTGQFIDGVLRWCESRGVAAPQITGIELDPRHTSALGAKYRSVPEVRIEQADFLADGETGFDYIIGNPPYVPITRLSEFEKRHYRGRYRTARGRFDLYLLFFEEALRRLAPGGRQVLITPEKFLYVETAAPLRNLLSAFHVEEIRLVAEDTFGELVTYPTITVINHRRAAATLVYRRDGSSLCVRLPSGEVSWLPVVEGETDTGESPTLAQLCIRVSCGVATGADSLFVRRREWLDPQLEPFARPTIAGRELTPQTETPTPRQVMLLPYDASGRLLPLDGLGGLGRYLQREDVRLRLLARTCSRSKPWYAFHETPALPEILRPKILCKDIGPVPRFWIDARGDIVPRHSVYYIVPRLPELIGPLVEYLRSGPAQNWLLRNCQRASRGFLRQQSRVLRRLPIPVDLASAALDAPRRQPGKQMLLDELAYD